jgi:hypothetical protein
LSTKIAMMTGAIGLVLTAGCVGEIADPSRFSDPALCPADLQEALFARRCGLEGCHVPFEPTGGLDFVSPDLHLRLVDQPATTCAGLERIDAQNPDASFLLVRLSPNPTCDGEPIDRMPLVGDPLSDDELVCVRAWVMRLASEANGGP